MDLTEKNYGFLVVTFFSKIIYRIFKLDVTNKSSSGDMSYFTPNGEWEVIGFPNRRKCMQYDYSEPFPVVTFYLIIRRKPLYYVFNLILPTIFITAVTLLVFYLPAESGEKVK